MTTILTVALILLTVASVILGVSAALVHEKESSWVFAGMSIVFLLVLAVLR